MKTAIITGASRGVGRATADILAQKGYRLIINCRSNFDLLEEVAGQLRNFTEVTTVHGAITDEVLKSALKIDLDASVPVLTEDDISNKHSDESSRDTSGDSHNPAVETQQDSDEILLVNNAGISTFNLCQDVTDDELSTMLSANVSDMFRLTRAVIPYMLKTGSGRILNISSVWGVCGASMESVYSLTKGAVNAFTRALGKELAPNHIPVNAVAIGCVDTDMNGWMAEEDRAAVEDEIPYGRMATPKEVGEFVYLIARAPAYLTAQIIQFDGGWI
ncbi:SDR family NAD(P)-dependent oxidoreductase [Oribacterium sp. WCC10]|uniref:SDR family NAD(P)-dependent oxidoreductase n=1 Tax=Oribacterium sp. WCC10 TaxID=1855343 RepID=UPI0008F2EC88|nr:SDR family NAD(P)-dependent oxidoreductase [Oribacterium sp. WCC10]SFG50747.1 3-oxoacyl-[acyl-carrier protein] reductase [Oribacterium sp. WCC10]